MPNVSRFHPLLVAFHWLLAILIIAALTLGFFGLARMPSADPHKLEGLRAHMSGGILIATLMGLRLFLRLRTARPAPATTGIALFDMIAPISHYGFYILVFGMAATGLATALLAGLFPIVFGHSGAALPATFLIYPTRIAHGIIAYTLVGLIALHVLAVVYHLFVRKDGLLRRMWFGRRAIPNA